MAAFAGLDVTLICEPGRVIVGNAGVLVTKTLYLKQGEIKNFVIVDAAMNDLIRPAFYDSYHAIWPVAEARRRRAYVADVVGPICETGDFLARDRALAQRPDEGDLLGADVGGRVRLHDVVELQHAPARRRGDGQGQRVRRRPQARRARGPDPQRVDPLLRRLIRSSALPGALGERDG